MGFEDEVEQSFSRPCRQSNSRTKRTHELTSSIVPRGTSFHCFSNRPFGVKHFQTIHHHSVDVAHGLVLLFGIGTKGPSSMGFEDEVEQSFSRPCRQSNSRTKRTHELTSSIVPRGTSFHCFSNRPFGVKHFQTIHHHSVDVAHGLVLLFGIGTKGPSSMGFEDEVEQSFSRPCRQSNRRTKRTHKIPSSIVPRGTSFHCFSNRPFGVKHFQTIHHHSVDVAHGLVLLFGIGTKGPSSMGFED